MKEQKGKRGTKTPYGPKQPPTRSHLLTVFAKKILKAAAARTGASESNIVEHLTRLHAGRLSAEEFAPVQEDRGQ